MLPGNNTIGLVLCGGQSSRMGIDKSLICYHGKPHRYHLFDLLNKLFDRTFLSCRPSQTNLSDGYPTLADLPLYESKGPMAGLLTAFSHFPNGNFLVLGCDYPFLTEKELTAFCKSIHWDSIATAFYNEEYGVYEPLLAWYSNRACKHLGDTFRNGQYSLQQFLKTNAAQKYKPGDQSTMISVDTMNARKEATDKLEHINGNNAK
jgi:molybdopterin-guanine dinucleotide biosynthesis protein A